MSDQSDIEWCNATWNPVSGCTRASAGCDNCYAVKQTYRLEKMGQVKKYGGLTVLSPNGKRHFNGVVRCDESALTIPLGWKKPRKIFMNSMSDLFHKEVPFEFIDKVFAVMALCPQHTFQVLTKRPERMAEYLNDEALRHVHGKLCAGRTEAISAAIRTTSTKHPDEINWPLPNVWLGTSTENQQTADERIPHLLRCPAAVRFISAEPLLGPIELPPIEWVHPEAKDDGLAAMARCGIHIGDEFLQAHAGVWQMPPEITSRRTGDGLWRRGHFVASHVTRERFMGTCQLMSQMGAEDQRGMVAVSTGSRNVVLSGLRTGNITDDPSICWPIAKAPKFPDWVIVGGESGPGARPCSVEWIRDIVQQCKGAGVPCFVKQGGAMLTGNYYDKGLRAWYERHNWEWPDPIGWHERDGQPRLDSRIRIETKARKGGDLSELPPSIRVRQMPEMAVPT